MKNVWIPLAGILGFLAVGIGAFGAHGLKEILSPEMKVVFETGNKYHFYHSLALLAVGILGSRDPHPSKCLRLSGWFFAIGIFVFSGTLYTLAITEIRILGAVTPIGGVSFLLGWFFLAWNYRKFQSNNHA